MILLPDLCIIGDVTMDLYCLWVIGHAGNWNFNCFGTCCLLPMFLECVHALSLMHHVNAFLLGYGKFKRKFVTIVGIQIFYNFSFCCISFYWIPCLGFSDLISHKDYLKLMQFLVAFCLLADCQLVLLLMWNSMVSSSLSF